MTHKSHRQHVLINYFSFLSGSGCSGCSMAPKAHDSFALFNQIIRKGKMMECMCLMLNIAIGGNCDCQYGREYHVHVT